MLQTASDHPSLRFPSSLASRAVAAKPESFIEGFTICILTRNIVISIPACYNLFVCFLNGVAEVLVSRIHIIKRIRWQQSLCEFIRQSNVVTPFGLAEVLSLNRHAWHCHSKPWWCNKRRSML